MKQRNYTNDDFIIILKTPDDIKWQTEIVNIITPVTITFAISSCCLQDTIKKITWDFGTGNQQKSVTNRKQELNEFNIDCKYKKAHNTTIMIQASVFTEDSVYIPIPIISTTVNHIIKEHYVKPEEFKQQIIDYYNTNVFTDDVASSIYKIANRLAFASNFINYTYREDMIGDAVVRMIEALTTQKFDPHRGNPFSYFTKIAFNAFCNRIKKEKKSREALTNYQNEVYSSLRSEGLLPYGRPEHSENSEEAPHEIEDYQYEDI